MILILKSTQNKKNYKDDRPSCINYDLPEPFGCPAGEGSGRAVRGKATCPQCNRRNKREDAKQRKTEEMSRNYIRQEHAERIQTAQKQYNLWKNFEDEIATIDTQEAEIEKQTKLLRVAVEERIRSSSRLSSIASSQLNSTRASKRPSPNESTATNSPKRQNSPKTNKSSVSDETFGRNAAKPNPDPKLIPQEETMKLRKEVERLRKQNLETIRRIQEMQEGKAFTSKEQSKDPDDNSHDVSSHSSEHIISTEEKKLIADMEQILEEEPIVIVSDESEMINLDPNTDPLTLDHIATEEVIESIQKASLKDPEPKTRKKMGKRLLKLQN